jgi:hypothetical protein
MDATTACDLVDRIFLTVDDSIFMPQYGFFQWSLFYLQGNGMPIDRIKEYLRAFNALVREKMIGVVDESVHARLISTLEQSASFHGALRTAAEQYCADTFGGFDIKASSNALARSMAPLTENFTSTDIKFKSAPWAANADVVLATYAVLIWGLDELGEAPIIAHLPQPLPLLLRPEPDLTFAQWLDVVRDKVREARRYRLHAFDILSGKTTLSPFFSKRPLFRAAFADAGGQEQMPPAADTLSNDILLEASLGNDDDNQSLRLRGRCDSVTLGELATLFSTMLTRVIEQPQSRISDLISDGKHAHAAGMPAHHAGETFTF